MATSPLRIDTTLSRPGSSPSSAKSPRRALTCSPHVHERSPVSSSSRVSPDPPTNSSATSLLIPGMPVATSDASVASSSKLPTPPADPSPPQMAEYVLAMHDFVPDHKNATCLSFRAGQVIHVLNRDPSGWWDGELDGARGWFPSNYVNGDLGLLVDDDVSLSSPKPSGHHPSRSTASTASFASSTPSRHGRFPRGDYCPPLMVPLLHALSLLQNAVRTGRVAHFQPSVACIISCVRSILAAADCLSRDASHLHRFPPLAQERKRVLSELAAIVTQAKRASVDELDEDARDTEVQKMVRLGGKVFSRVRRFLAVAVQCGVDLPEKEASVDYPAFAAELATSEERVTVEVEASSTLQVPPSPRSEEETVRNARWLGTEVLPQHLPKKAAHGWTRALGKARSMSDLRETRRGYKAASTGVLRLASKKSESQSFAQMCARRHRLEPSTSSASSSSISSIDTAGSPVTPAFPAGPASIEELTEALRYTHDQYLSAIAAFIGHAHSHTRSSHASSTGHAYELVKEIVQTVCRLLTIVEAVLKHPTVPPHKAEILRSAKDALFEVTTGLADSVRALTKPLPPDMTEEQEMASLIRAATDAVKVGADCVGAIKVCLARTALSGEKSFNVVFPRLTDEDHNSPASPDRFDRPHSFVALMRMPMMEEDEGETAVLAPPPIQISSTDGLSVSDAGTSASTSRPTDNSSSSSSSDLQQDVLALVSDSRTDDEGSSWEGSAVQLPTPSDDSVPHGVVSSMSAEADVSADSWIVSHDYSLEDVAYNSDGHLVGASLPALVEKMTPHSSIVDPAFSSVFFLTFRLFTSPEELVQAVIDRYNLLPPQGLSEEQMYVWQQRKGIPVRLRVSNFIKTWLEVYWRTSSDSSVLPLLDDFNNDALAHMFPGPSQRIRDIINVRMSQTHQTSDAPASQHGHERARDAGMLISPSISNEVPRPIMSKTLQSNLRRRDFHAIALTDFDSLELARQMTIMECALYCAIKPEDVLEGCQDGGRASASVRAVTTFSTVTTGWVAESILSETDTKKRTVLVKFFIKLADRCVQLNNFSTSRSILAALDSSTISRLNQTWAGIPQKQRIQLEAVRKLADHARNYHEYRSKLRNTAPPAVPFLGLYLTDLTFCREGNPSHRSSPRAADKKLLNFNRYQKMARIIQDLQRFQVPYLLKETVEVQAYLNEAFDRSKHHGDFQDLYRRSLLIEPKLLADQTPTSGDARGALFPWSTRAQIPTATHVIQT